jgi:hypothetical protein
MTATTKSPRRQLAKIVQRPHRWLAVVAFLALMPKCVLCVLAYAGIGAALGLGAELCGAPGSVKDAWPWSLALPGIALGFVGCLARSKCPRQVQRPDHG